MQLHKIRGGTIEDLEAKKYNLGVGISLGNKWFTVENIIGLIRWCLPRTREYVVVYVADSIHAINIEVRKGYKYEKALVVADQMGTDLLENIKSEVKKVFPPDEALKIKYIKWKTINNDSYREKVNYLYNLYNSNTEFKNHLQSIVKDFVSNEHLKFSDKEIDRLANYIIEELPEQTARVPLGEYTYDAFTYPYDGEIVKMAEQIQNGEIYPEIKERIMDTEPKVFLEVR